MQRNPFPEKIWSDTAFQQIKRLTKAQYIKLLEKDPNWQSKGGNAFVNPNYKKPWDIVTIHYHNAKDTFNSSSLIKQMLNQICWTEENLKEWRAIR